MSGCIPCSLPFPLHKCWAWWTLTFCSRDQLQLRSLTALFAESGDCELLVLALPAFTDRSGKAGGQAGGGRWRQVWAEDCSFSETNDRHRGTSSALGDRALGIGSPLLQLSSKLVFYHHCSFISLPLLHFFSNCECKLQVETWSVSSLVLAPPPHTKKTSSLLHVL